MVLVSLVSIAVEYRQSEAIETEVNVELRARVLKLNGLIK
jgi:hypothetical protein